MNPVTYEVVRNRLLAITDEMRIALQSVSGSPTVTEATDFFTGLYLPDGEFATMGFQVTHEAPPVGALIRHIAAAGRPVRDGDMFIGNDPYVGALHQNDVQMAAPVYHGGEVIAWAGVMAHETDMGGMNFASWCPGATEVYQEGLRIPAVKLADQGEVREDVLEMILAASRLPAALGLDIRAFIATLNVARDRLASLCGAYGADQVRGVMARMIADSEQAVRDRLAALPDGTVHVRDFLEHDGHANRLYAVDLVAAKRGQTLVLDFSGSSPQAPGFINATRAGLAGGVTGALIPTLGFGIPWNAGLLRPVTITAPDGLICTARHPAPVGAATVETIWTVTNVVQRALNTFLACTPEFAGPRAGGQLRHHGHLQHGRRQPVRRAVRPASARPAGGRLRRLRHPGRGQRGRPGRGAHAGGRGRRVQRAGVAAVLPVPAAAPGHGRRRASPRRPRRRDRR